MQEVLALSADRLAGSHHSVADRADHLRALDVVDATVWAEDDVLAGLHACPANRAVGSSAAIAITSERSLRRHPS
jgi:hypothetical protein